MKGSKLARSPTVSCTDASGTTSPAAATVSVSK